MRGLPKSFRGAMRRMGMPLPTSRGLLRLGLELAAADAAEKKEPARRSLIVLGAMVLVAGLAALCLVAVLVKAYAPSSPDPDRGPLSTPIVVASPPSHTSPPPRRHRSRRASSRALPVQVDAATLPPALAPATEPPK